MSILIVTPEFPPTSGGIGINTFDLARHWSTKEPVVVVTPAVQDRADPIVPNVKVVQVPRYGRVRRAIAVRAAVVRLLSETRFDAIYCTHWRASGVPVRAALFGTSQRPPLIQAVHGSELLYLLSRPATLDLLLFKWTASAVDLFAGEGTYQVRLLGQLGISGPRVVTGTCGIEPDRFKPASSRSLEDLRKRHDLIGRRVVLTVGRLVERKGHDTVIRAMADIRHVFPDVVYVIAGAGPYAADLRRLTTQMGLPAAAVRFVGAVRTDELAYYYALADIFVMPNRVVGSDVEGFGLVFIEAALCGKPAIGGRSGGAVDAIIDGVTGRLVDPSSTRELASAVIELLSDPTLAARMGLAARERALRDFDYRVVAPRLRSAFPTSIRDDTIGAGSHG